MEYANRLEYNQDFQPRTGGRFKPTHGFSLVNQDIRVNRKNSFHVRFPNIWDKYKLPKVTDKTVYDSWLADQMIFWQMQLNFAVWCATTGSGVGKDLLSHPDPMTRSIFRFHAYYQTRRILSEMSCPLPTDSSWNPLNNGIDKNAYERICNDFGISTRNNWRQKFDPCNGMGSVFYTKTIEQAHGAYRTHYITTKKIKSKTNRFDSKFQVDGDPVDYIEQLFDHDPDITDKSIRKGDAMAAIGSFVQDDSEGISRPGVSRINDTVRTLVWAILGAQAQARSSILGSGKAFDAQKQFLANVEDAINSTVDLPDSIDRYQRTLQYAQSKLDFVVGHGLYLLPSNMEILVGTVNGYNNFIQIATDDMQLGVNSDVNTDSRPTVEDSPLFSQAPNDSDPPLVEDSGQSQSLTDFQPDPLTHDEKKLSLFLVAAAIFLFFW